MTKSKREHGQGTIYLRKDGRWYGAVQNGYNENGKPKMITVYGKTEAEAKRKLKEKIKLINSDGLILQNNTIKNITVEGYCTNWLKNVKVNGKYAIIMGNEGNGVRENIKNLSDEKLYIKMNNDCNI